MFVWSDFREDGKWRREKWRENNVFGCLVEGRKDERFWWDPLVFSPPPPKHNLSKLERKWEWKLDKNIWTKLPTFSFYYYYFFFWATSTWHNKCGLPTIFFFFFFFHPSNQIQMRKTKIFSILPLFHPLPIFYPPTFPSSEPHGPLVRLPSN